MTLASRCCSPSILSNAFFTIIWGVRFRQKCRLNKRQGHKGDELKEAISWTELCLNAALSWPQWSPSFLKLSWDLTNKHYRRWSSMHALVARPRTRNARRVIWAKGHHFAWNFREKFGHENIVTTHCHDIHLLSWKLQGHPLRNILVFSLCS